MLQSRDRKLLVLRASSKTDRGVGRNHPLLRLRERAAREQHAEENLWSATPTLGHATAKEDWRYKMTRKVTRWRSSTSDVRAWMSTRRMGKHVLPALQRVGKARKRHVPT